MLYMLAILVDNLEDLQYLLNAIITVWGHQNVNKTKFIVISRQHVKVQLLVDDKYI